PVRLLLLGPDPENGGRDGRDREAHGRRARGRHLVAEDVLLDGRLPEPAELARPAYPPPPLAEHALVAGARQRAVALVARLAHLGQERGRGALAEKATHLVAPALLLGAVLVAHHYRTARRTVTTSKRPLSPISALMTSVKNEVNSQPPSAAQK